MSSGRRDCLLISKVHRRTRVLALSAIILTGCTVATAATVQNGGLRITVVSQLKPYKLPRDKPAPIAVFVAGHLQNAKGGIPPQLQKLTVRVNHHGLLQSKGLPVCKIPEVQPASTGRALASCGEAIIGSGQFWANIVLPDQGAYRTQGRLLIFNGREGNRPLLLAHIYTTHPFATSFVIPFSIEHVSKGPYGTELRASLPQALGSWTGSSSPCDGNTAGEGASSATSTPPVRPARAPSAPPSRWPTPNSPLPGGRRWARP